MPTQEAIAACQQMILADEVKRIDDAFRIAFMNGDGAVAKDCIYKQKKAKTRLMKIIRERFPGEFKQPGVFIDTILWDNRVGW